MTHASPTPVPDHGTGWGLLFLFLALYGLVGVVGLGTVVAMSLHRFERRTPTLLRYLLVVVLLGSLAVAGFTAAHATDPRRVVTRV